jgi:multidrug resistance efflux pump
MTRFLAFLGRFAVTLVAVAIACVVGWQLWVYYLEAPWTRDGRVLADLQEAAPDVSGLVTDVFVHDNEHVQKGQVLFRIDPDRYRLALQQAEAALASSQAAAQEAVREMNRYRSLSTLEVSTEQQQQRTAAAQQAGAAYQQAIANRDLAALNLQRTDVKATVNGIITNFDMRPGNYVAAGKAVAAIVDTDSIYVDGYFEETKLARIHVGDPARVRLMGQHQVIDGHVESVAGGIADPERNASDTLLANINPTFSWVRLAQRVPVRVAIDHVPAGVALIPGRTATVEIVQKDGTQAGPLRLIAREPRNNAPS